MRNSNKDLRQSIENIDDFQYNIQDLTTNFAINQTQLDAIGDEMKIPTRKVEATKLYHHQMVDFEVLKIKNTFMKA